MKRSEKIALLKSVLNGQTAELEQLRAQLGRPYSIEEKVAQQKYLTLLCSYKATQDDVTRIFGHYDLSDVPGSEAYVLPNKMKIFF